MAIAYLLGEWSVGAWTDAMKRIDKARELRVAPDQLGDVSDIEYAVCWKPPTGLLKTFTNLKIIFSLGAGVDHIFNDQSLPDVPIVRVVEPDLTARMSEFILLQVLYYHRQQWVYDRAQQDKKWQVQTQWPSEDVRVGIMGLGHLGQDAAKKLNALGFKVSGWSKSEKTVENVTCYHGDGGLKPFLNDTDILVCLLPHTPATTEILNMRVFENLAQDGVLGGPVLINVGRGKLQNENDIITALDNGILLGAQLDVFNEEPLPETSPLWAHEAVRITPHSAADSSPLSITRYFYEQIVKFESGGELENIVDKSSGY